MRLQAAARGFFSVTAGAVLLCVAGGQTTLGQTPPSLAGDYVGMMERTHLVLHVQPDASGKLNCTVDLPNDHVYYEGGLACAGFTASQGKLSFTVPTMQGSFSGQIGNDGKTLTGIWTRGRQVKLVLTRDDFEPAEKQSAIDGDWQGLIDVKSDPQPVTIHLRSDRAGKEYLTLDVPKSPDMFGVPGANVTLKGGLFSFDITIVHAHYSGKLSRDRKKIVGAWEQGPESYALNLARPEAPGKPSLVDGDWAGVLTTGDGALHAQLQIISEHSGKLSAIFSSPDQYARHLECGNEVLNGRDFSFEVPSMHGRFTGTVAADGNAMEGTWSQSGMNPLPFRLQRGEKGSAGDAPAEADAPVEPLSLEELYARLDRELKPLAENPAFAGMPGLGIAIGLYKQGRSEVLTYGTARPDSLFEIGSASQTFTGLMLASMTAKGIVTLETPVRELLPAGMVEKSGGPEVTLVSLATFHSGMQHLTDGFRPADAANPYADFGPREMHVALAQRGVALMPDIGFDFSDAGIALLGEALADRAGLSYEALLQREVLQPLHMEHTFLTVPAGEQAQMITGHSVAMQPVKLWQFNAMAPVKGIHSNVRDMLAYVAAQLAPPEGTLAQAMPIEQVLRSQTDEGREHHFRIGLTWMYQPGTRNYFTQGMTGGFSSFAFFDPQQQVAGVVLMNRGGMGWAENLAYRIEGLMEGDRAFPLVR